MKLADAAPGSVLVDKDGDEWTRLAGGAECRHGRLSSHAVHIADEDYGPFRLVTPAPVDDALTRRVTALEAEAEEARRVAVRDRAELERRIDGLGRGALLPGKHPQRAAIRPVLARWYIGTSRPGDADLMSGAQLLARVWRESYEGPYLWAVDGDSGTGGHDASGRTDAMAQALAAACAIWGKIEAVPGMADAPDRGRLVKQRDELARELSAALDEAERLRVLLDEALKQRDVARDEAGALLVDSLNLTAVLIALGETTVDAARERIATLQSEAARAHDLANEVTALRCGESLDAESLDAEAPKAKRVRRASWMAHGHSACLTDCDSGEVLSVVTTDPDIGGTTNWVVGGGGARASGRDASRHIAKEQAVQVVRDHIGALEIVTP